MADSIAKRLVVSAVLLLAALLLAACGGGEEPTPTPTKTPLPAAAAARTATPQAPEPPAPTPSQAAAPTELPTSAPQAAEPTATPAPVIEQIGTVTADQLNIRSEPNTSGTVVKMAMAGQTFTVVGKSDDGQWLQVAENGAPVGWAAAEFVSVEERVAQAPATDSQGSTQPQATQPSQPAAGGAFAPATMNSPDFGAQAFLWWRPELAENDLNLLKNGGFNWVKQILCLGDYRGRRARPI